MVTLLVRRLALALAAAFDVYAEAQAMARAAYRRYPFIEE